MRICINTTLDCNLRCKYCYLKCKGYPKKYMEEKTAFKFIELCNKLYGKLDIHFYGGEPLLNYALIEKIVNEYKSRFNYILTTNGTLLNPEKIKLFKKYNFEVHVSFDGLPTVQNLQRPTKGGKPSSFILNKLKLFGDYSNLTVNLVASKNSVPELFESYMFLLSKGIRRIKIMEDMMVMWDKKNIQELTKQYLKIIKYYIKNKKRQMLFFNNLERYDPSETCFYNMNNTLSLFPNGDVFVCGCEVIIKNKTFRLGNITKNNFNECLSGLSFGSKSGKALKIVLKKPKLIELSKVESVLLCDLMNYKQKSKTFSKLYKNRLLMRVLKNKIYRYYLKNKIK